MSPLFWFSTHHILSIFLIMASAVAALLVGSHWGEWCGWVSLPITLPAVVILGGDELDEIYGIWGSRGLIWLLSLPVMLIWAWLISRVLFHPIKVN